MSPSGFDDEYDEPAPIPRRSADSAPFIGSAPTAGSAPSASEVEAAGTWHRVEKPTADPSPTRAAGETPDQTDEDASVPPIPGWFKAAGLGALAVVLVAAGWIGVGLGRGSVEPTPTPTTQEASVVPEAPRLVGDMVRGEVTTSSPTGREVVSANYSDGTNRVLLIISNPHDDLMVYLEESGVSDPAQVSQETMCGLSVDSDGNVCAQLRGETGLMLVGLTDQSTGELGTLLDRFHAAMTDG